MAIFSKKIQDAYYLNEKYNIIEIIFEDDNGNLVNHIIEADPGHEDFKDLEKEGYDAKTLIKKTDEYKKKQSSAFSVAVNREARILAEKMLGLDTLNNKKKMLEKEEKDLKIRLLTKKEQIEKEEKDLKIRLLTKKEQIEKQEKDLKIRLLTKTEQIEKEEKDLKIRLLTKKEELDRELKNKEGDLKIKLLNKKEELDKELKEKEESVLNLGQKERKMKTIAGSAFFDTILESNADKDELFKLKLWALEKEFVKKMTTEDKTKIRKSQRMIEVFSIMDKYLNQS